MQKNPMTQSHPLPTSAVTPPWCVSKHSFFLSYITEFVNECGWILSVVCMWRVLIEARSEHVSCGRRRA
jgi:hypothetical protein